MPILVRPVREQLEHDRIIRLLQARYKKKHDPVTNVGGEPPTSVVIGTAEFVPDLILLTNDKARKLDGVVEVETGESVNSLETLAQWVPFNKLRVPFHLYVPPHTLDTVRRLCREHNVTVAELWTYHTNLDQVRFTLIQKATDAQISAARKIGLSGAPKLKVAPPPPPPPPTPPPPPPPVRSAEVKLPVRTAAQKAALGKFVAAAAKASAAKSAAGNPAAPAVPVAKAAGKPAASAAPAPAEAKAAAKPPAAPAKPAVVAKPAVAGKPVAPAKTVAPAKAAAPAAVKPAAPAKAAIPAKPTPPAKAVVSAKAAPPAKAVVPAKPVAKPAPKVAAKPVAKPVKKAAPAKAKAAKPAKAAKRR